MSEEKVITEAEALEKPMLGMTVEPSEDSELKTFMVN